MPIVTLSKIHKSYGPQIIFDQMDMRVYRGEKVGLIGINGSGKTTLFKLILGQTKPDIGKIIHRKDLKIGYLPQEPTFDNDLTVIEQMHLELAELFNIQQKMLDLTHSFASLAGEKLRNAMKEYDRLHNNFEISGGYEYESKIAAILAGVGLDEKFLNAKTSTLSGGQLARLGLAKVLFKETNLLLLDEPTNHLDLQATIWLEKFLKNYNGAVIIISHDRYLLDNTVSRILELKNRNIISWKGNYTCYTEEKNKSNLQQQREYDQRIEMIDRTRDFIARNKDQEGMRKTARGRKTRLDKLLKNNPDFLTKPSSEKKVNFNFKKVHKKGSLILQCENLKKSFGDLTLFENLTLDILAGQRLGITGPNGTGKSTLIKMALGDVSPSQGTIKLAKNLSIGYLDQQAMTLDPEKTVLEEAAQADPSMDNAQLRSKVAAFLFQGNDVFKKVNQLSGGQQNRLILCKLVLKNPQALILDEPTNHLDIDTKETLENALKQYQGTIITVSHDRFFLDKIADSLLVIGTDELGNKKIGSFEFVHGNYSKYAALLTERNEKKQATLKTEASKPKRPNRKKESIPTPPELKKFNAWSVNKIEDEITKTEASLSRFKELFGQEDFYRSSEKIQQLKKDHDEIQAQLDLLYRAYELRS